MRKGILIAVVFMAVLSCKKSKGPKQEEAPLPPAKAVLSAPTNNAACIEGTSLSALQSSVTLSWTQAANADSYDIVVKNLLTNVAQTLSSSQPSVVATLSKSTPYSWYVVSKSSKASSTAQSEVWRFYNAGDVAAAYAPFPAEMVSPVYDQTINAVNGKITLDWTASDVDNDIASYAIYLGATNSPVLLNENVTSSELANVSVTTNTTYYWKVVTKDAAGNTSDSGVFKFRVN